jgi:cytochrome P450
VSTQETTAAGAEAAPDGSGLSGTGRLGDPGPRPPFPGPRAMVAGIRQARAATKRMPMPRGANNLSLKRTWRARHDVLNLLLESYFEYGAVFGMRILHDRQVFMIGPEANHFVLVSGRENFVWREGRFGDLITLLGDGLLTIDGEYHDASRAIMMPAFHKERILRATATMNAEAAAAIDPVSDGDVIDVYGWTRNLAMRIAMRALFGFDPDSAHAHETVSEFERGLSFHGEEYIWQIAVGPGTPYARLKSARAELERLVGGEIRARRERGDDPEAGSDILGSLLAATDAEGNSFTDTQVLDHVLTLLFAGHDTTTATVTFLAYELARNPSCFEPLQTELAETVGTSPAPTPEQLLGGLPELSKAIDETLRLYPPAWIGPRRVVRDFEFKGVGVPAGLPLSYSSWVSHRLPDVWDEPDAFRPDRFEPEARARLPTGAYVPFGMGPRVCIGKRFGYTEVHAVASALLRRFEWELVEESQITVLQAPTLSPKGGLRIRLYER